MVKQQLLSPDWSSSRRTYGHVRWSRLPSGHLIRHHAGLSSTATTTRATKATNTGGIQAGMFRKLLKFFSFMSLCFRTIVVP